MVITMDWNLLLAPVRVGDSVETSQPSETRTHFQRDYDRIIFSSPFRRLQNKTQVFPLPGSVFVHNRLTHSLEVASVGRSLGNNLIEIIQQQGSSVSPHLLEQIPTIISTACLAHDLGNPPFGHSGEEAIRTYFLQNAAFKEKLNLNSEQWADIIRFEGNANALRLLTQQLVGRRPGGFRLSYPVLASIVKYPWESMGAEKKFGFFQSEKDLYFDIAKKLGIPQNTQSPLAFSRHPLVYLVEAADDISYQIMDIEDAHKLGILTSEEVKTLFLSFFEPESDGPLLRKITETMQEVTDPNEQIAFLRAITIGHLVKCCSIAFEKNYQAIMNGEKIPALIEQLDERGSSALRTIKKVAFEQVYNHRAVVEIELAGYQILGNLIEKLSNTVVDPQTTFSKKVRQLIPKQYVVEQDDPYQKIMGILDFVSGMTDVYALEMYRTLQGISIPGINR
jgi:dGTPase